MQKRSYAVDRWEICGFQPEDYRREALISGLYDDKKWISTQTPKDIHSILIENKLIEHPYYQARDMDCRFVEQMIWVYRTELMIPEELVGHGALELKLEGVDTYASVLLNGKEIAFLNNMFVEHSIEISDKVSAGRNTLCLEFDLMGKHASQKDLPEGFWTNYSTERAYARKAAYHYGWDWTSRIATIGLWKPVSLIHYGKARINDVHILASDISLEEKKAALDFTIDTKIWMQGNYSYRVEITAPTGERIEYVTDQTAFRITLENVSFWWTYDLGRPNLYRIQITLLQGEEGLDYHSVDYGIRKLKLRLRSEDDKEKRFLFELNDVPLMARGANWVPVSNFLSTAEDERYRKLILMAKQANMNMLNLWGGGIYEKDIFYQTCDQEGILVWQYLMFVCGEYPDYDEDFLNNTKEEVKKAVTRLRNYACIALWVGNVEGDLISEKIALPREMYGNRLFRELLPNWMQSLDPARSYIPTSPWSEEGPANSMESGDRHNWDVWFTDIPYTHYKYDYTRFASEFGLHAAPVKQTIESYIGSENLQLDNFYFKYMNKDQSLNRMYYYMKQHIGEPGNLDEYIDYSMFTQAEGLKFAAEHYRRNFPATSGALIWQLNDCMPVHSWSLIDYDLIPKASYYYSGRFFDPVLLSLEELDDTLTGIWIHNNRKEELQDTIKIEVKDFLGNCIHREELDIRMEGNRVQKLKEIRVGGRYYPNVIIPGRPRCFYLKVEGKICRRNIRYFGSYQEIAWPKAIITATCHKGVLRLQSDCFARFVKVDGKLKGLRLSDNYFDLEAGETKEIQIEGDMQELYVKALNSDVIWITNN